MISYHTMGFIPNHCTHPKLSIRYLSDHAPLKNVQASCMLLLKLLRLLQVEDAQVSCIKNGKQMSVNLMGACYMHLNAC